MRRWGREKRIAIMAMMHIHPERFQFSPHLRFGLAQIPGRSGQYPTLWIQVNSGNDMCVPLYAPRFIFLHRPQGSWGVLYCSTSQRICMISAYSSDHEVMG
jgi:hypothetical protein